MSGNVQKSEKEIKPENRVHGSIMYTKSMKGIKNKGLEKITYQKF